MKYKFPPILIFILVALGGLLSPATLRAQLQEMAPSDSVSASNNDETVTTEGDFHSGKMQSTQVRDSLKLNHQRLKQGTEAQKSLEKAEAEEQDSILSFHFLYYIIRKFKFSDIVDH